MNSPIKYYGGKSYMTDVLKDHFPLNYTTYVEGFGGGASLLFSKNPYGIEIYNDINKNVYSLFKVLSDKEMFQRMKDRLDLTYYSEELNAEYKLDLQKDIPLEDRAYKYFFVNRSSFNSVGGFSVNPVVRRTMSKSVSDFLSSIDKLPQIHDRLSRVIILNENVFDLLDRYDSEDAFIYLDPPYVWETRLSNQRYENEMTNEEHERLLTRLQTIKAKVMVSGYDCELYNRFLSSWNKYEFKPNNSTLDKNEIIWLNYKDFGRRSKLELI